MLIDGSPDGLWNLLETILTVLFFAIGFYFLSKYYKDRGKDVQSVNVLNIGYAIFFWGTGINQFVYLINYNPEIWPTIDNFIGTGNFYMWLGSTETTIELNTQVMSMILIMFLTVLGLLYGQDKYLKNDEKLKVFKLVILTTIFIIIPEFVWYFIINRDALEGQTLAPGENIFLMIINGFAALVLAVIIWNLIIFYFIMAVKSPKGFMKTKASLIAFGIFLLYFGLFGGNLGKNFLDGYLILLGPIIFFIGLLSLFIGFNKEK
jgi:hypothetical protein